MQVYIKDLESSVPAPIHELAGFARVHLDPAQVRTVAFAIRPQQLARIDANGNRTFERGTFQVAVGGIQPGYEQIARGQTQVLTGALGTTT